MPNVRFKVRPQRRPAQFSRAATVSQKDDRIETSTVSHHFFETMCPTAFLAPTLTAKTCFICTQPQNAFFQAQLAVQDNRANGKKSFPGRVPGPKKRTKMVPKSGPFQKEFFCSAAKKVPKIGPAPGLA